MEEVSSVVIGGGGAELDSLPLCPPPESPPPLKYAYRRPPSPNTKLDITDEEGQGILKDKVGGVKGNLKDVGVGGKGWMYRVTEGGVERRRVEL